MPPPGKGNALALYLNYVLHQVFPSVLDRKEEEDDSDRFLGLDFGVILVAERARLLKSHLFAFLISPLLTVSS